MPSWSGWCGRPLPSLDGRALGGVLRGDHLDFGVGRGIEQHRNLADNLLSILS